MNALTEASEDDPTERFLSLRSAFLTGTDDDWLKAVQSGGNMGQAGNGEAVGNGGGSSQAVGT